MDLESMLYGVYMAAMAIAASIPIVMSGDRRAVQRYGYVIVTFIPVASE